MVNNIYIKDAITFKSNKLTFKLLYVGPAKYNPVGEFHQIALPFEIRYLIDGEPQDDEQTEKAWVFSSEEFNRIKHNIMFLD